MRNPVGSKRALMRPIGFPLVPKFEAKQCRLKKSIHIEL
jgi:hypothetical protein